MYLFSNPDDTAYPSSRPLLSARSTHSELPEPLSSIHSSLIRSCYTTSTELGASGVRRVSRMMLRRMESPRRVQRSAGDALFPSSKAGARKKGIA